MRCIACIKVLSIDYSTVNKRPRGRQKQNVHTFTLNLTSFSVGVRPFMIALEIGSSAVAWRLCKGLFWSFARLMTGRVISLPGSLWYYSSHP